MVAFGQMMVGHSKGPGVDPVATVRRLSGLGAEGGRTSGSGKDRLVKKQSSLHLVTNGYRAIG